MKYSLALLLVCSVLALHFAPLTTARPFKLQKKEEPKENKDKPIEPPVPAEDETPDDEDFDPTNDQPEDPVDDDGTDEKAANIRMIESDFNKARGFMQGMESGLYNLRTYNLDDKCFSSESAKEVEDIYLEMTKGGIGFFRSLYDLY